MKKLFLTLIAVMTITTNIFAQSWNVYGNSISNGSFIGTKNNQPLLFKTNTGNAGVSSFPQMVITGGVEPNKGYVGINIMNPTERLHVNQGGILIQNATSVKSGPFLKFQDNNNKNKISLQLENKGPISNGLTFKVQDNNEIIDNVLFVSANCKQGFYQGAVGIGTDMPVEKLQIKDGNVMISGHNDYWSYYGFNKTENDIYDFGGLAYVYTSFPSEKEGLALFTRAIDPSVPTYPFFISNSDDETFRNNIGFGTDRPNQKIHVASGNILITKNLFGQHAPGNENGSVLFGDIPDGEYRYGHWGIGYENLHDGRTQGLNFWKVWDNEGGPQNAVLFLSSARQYLGNVGIGTAIPTQKLSVNGAVLAKEVIVTLEDNYWPTTRKETWPDYVFSKNYNLMNLLELKTYVTDNKHLPGVPSAKEILDEGVHLGEMNAILVEKVEELTLYIIDLQEQVNELKQQLQNK